MSSGDDQRWEDWLTAITLQAGAAITKAGRGASSGRVQTKMRVGFVTAGNILNRLEALGVVGPSKGSKPRDVLMTADEFANAISPPAPAPQPTGDHE